MVIKSVRRYDIANEHPMVFPFKRKSMGFKKKKEKVYGEVGGSIAHLMLFFGGEEFMLQPNSSCDTIYVDIWAWAELIVRAQDQQTNTLHFI